MVLAAGSNTEAQAFLSRGGQTLMIVRMRGLPFTATTAQVVSKRVSTATANTDWLRPQKKCVGNSPRFVIRQHIVAVNVLMTNLLEKNYFRTREWRTSAVSDVKSDSKEVSHTCTHIHKCEHTDLLVVLKDLPVDTVVLITLKKHESPFANFLDYFIHGGLRYIYP